MEPCAFPFNFFSLKTSLNASLSSLWEHQIPGKLRKKSYVRGSLLSGRIGFNFLLARVAVPRDCTTCRVWAESRIRGHWCSSWRFRHSGYHLERTNNSAFVLAKAAQQCEGDLPLQTDPKPNARWARLTNTHTLSAVRRCWPCGRLRPAGLRCSAGRHSSSFPGGPAFARRRRQSRVETLATS